MSTILVVDDDPSCRQLLRQLLPRMGHMVIVASNGVDALDALKTHTPDLVLLDLAMPQMDGLSFLRTLRELEQFRSLPVILVSGLASRETVRICASLGVRDYLVKSDFTMQTLCHRLEKYLPPQTKATQDSNTQTSHPAGAAAH